MLSFMSVTASDLPVDGFRAGEQDEGFESDITDDYQ